MHIRLHILIETILLGKNSKITSVHITFLKEFLAQKQGNMTVTKYLDKFTHLSRYAPDELNTDPKRQERFLDGLIGPLNY
jgi:hypothetical protein